MSTDALQTLATIQAITAAEVALVRISTFILIVLGNLGEILNIIIFVQPIFRNNPCVIYFLAAACARLFYVDYTILINGLTLGYNMNPGQGSWVLCKLRFYVFYISSILPPSFIILACLDRFLLSSPNANIRSWSQRRIAYRLIAVVLIIWMIFSIHAFFGSTLYNVRGYSYCSFQGGSYGLFINLYLIIINYLLPPILMTILGLLTIFNVRRTQRQIRPNGATGYMGRKDRYLLRMLLFQVLINVVFTLPLGIFQVYYQITAHWQKSLVQQYWELFLLALGFAIFYIPYCTGFYIYTLTASIFRKELKRLILRFYRRFFPRGQTAVTTAMTNATQIMRNPTVNY